MPGMPVHEYTDLLTGVERNIEYEFDAMDFSSSPDVSPRTTPLSSIRSNATYSHTPTTCPSTSDPTDLMQMDTDMDIDRDIDNNQPPTTPSEMNHPPSSYESFPCLVAVELTEAASTPLVPPNTRTPSMNDGDTWVGTPETTTRTSKPANHNTNANSTANSTSSPDSDSIDLEPLDDETTLAAATNVLSLYPPFWPSSDSSDSDDDDDNRSFANDGWKSVAQGHSIPQEHVVPQGHVVHGPRVAKLVRDELGVREWVRRAAVDMGR